jgi:NAD(P)-dependent dehydrogenase (short-subunit alcohol dehydrogenase family)
MTQWALITGCSSGIGRALVSALLAHGWGVYATLRHASERIDLFKEELQEHPDRLRILELDVTNRDQRVTVIRSADRLDLLVNNAGYGLFGPLEELGEDQWRQQLETNLLGAALMTQAALPKLRESRGRVVFLSSVMGTVGHPLTSAYCASKWALEGLAESLSLELAPHGVRVNLVQLMGHRTSFAENCVEAAHPLPIYVRQRRLLTRLRKRMSTTRGFGYGGDPETLAKRLATKLHRGDLPFRWRVEPAFKFWALLRHLIPDHLRMALMRRAHLRALHAEALS